jgi:regulatory protein
MDVIARRDHSEQEIRKKMDDRFVSEVIDLIVIELKERSWLPNSPEQEQNLAGRFASTLHRRNKSQWWINQKLKSIGLPKVDLQEDIELEKALQLAGRKMRGGPLDREAVPAIARTLRSRGYSSSIIQKVISEMKKRESEETP